MTTPLKQQINATNVYTKQVPGRGNGIFAAQDIAPRSEVVFVSRPLMVALETSELQTRCYYCYSSPGDASLRPEIPNGQTLKTCGGCKVVKFCHRKCQTRAWSEYHRLECKLYGRLHPRILPSTSRSIIRLLKQHEANLLPHSEWDQLLALKSHQEDFLREDLFIMMKGIKSYCGTNHSEETILRIACVLLVNSFTLTNPTYDPLGSILHPKPALMNHSCDPNAFVRFDIPPTSSREEFPPYGNISVHALRPIARGEEVTVSYIDTTLPFDNRQGELKARYFFTCSCSLCSRGRDAATDMFYHPVQDVATDTTQPAILAEIAETSDQAEQFLMGLESQSGLEHTPIDSIKHIMHRLALTRSWPLWRYPWPDLRRKLFLRLLDSQRYSEALWQSAVFVRVIHPVMYHEQEHHPVRVVQMWTFWNLCWQCVESLGERSSDDVSHDLQTLRMLCSVLVVMIDDIHRIMNQGTRSNGKLEKLIDGALQNVRRDGVFWDAYQQNKAETRQKVFSWIDDQVKALLRKEDVSQDIVDMAFRTASF
ncbi:uncharacterized protein Z520_07038 [Fonsecaea multimorphosa CBS 102226]|uniref:Uncharacterized protein n=1 Tax=Fonsecaea multimorphosa CBS 102226 TaxID=1442371 RepID=A0A0D2K1S1_9EURO|nr:uncharacterized protein Z520_07038 [Fonsecaea multimorphosa CBS 102226]KIX96924.1 hypothetical protein Z520_07038 [Fonsecaea multimorphosa CBS 102226]OAL23122.1 hypothetical protein AYO22_06615 [Fonsecaea multimorphosa]